MNTNDAVRLGSSLRRIDPALLKNGDVSVWFKGAEPYLDVFLELSPTGSIEWLQVTVRGRSLTWGRQHTLRMGRTNELHVSAGVPQSKTLVDDAVVDAAFAHVVVALLGAQPHEPLLCAAGTLVAELLPLESAR